MMIQNERNSQHHLPSELLKSYCQGLFNQEINLYGMPTIYQYILICKDSQMVFFSSIQSKHIFQISKKCRALILYIQGKLKLAQNTIGRQLKKNVNHSHLHRIKVVILVLNAQMQSIIRVSNQYVLRNLVKGKDYIVMNVQKLEIMLPTLNIRRIIIVI
ncbi:unnamed protein product [Paramecium octaurelia]|uniref:Uncharacterized protein n=1 Tax=Paramecium octaurelia TaxID=43137 RepID=A0A8S1X6L6_PAROT|nr:unnamed protein product [Paramecium octaurelia]